MHPGCAIYWFIANGGNMISMLQFDQSTLANMTAALELCLSKTPSDRDNPAVRKYIADEILSAALKGQTSHGELASLGLKVVNGYLFPPGRAWLRALEARESTWFPSIILVTSCAANCAKPPRTVRANYQ